jgi:hypothetical protein
MTFDELYLQVEALTPDSFRITFDVWRLATALAVGLPERAARWAITVSPDRGAVIAVEGETAEEALGALLCALTAASAAESAQ